MLDKFFQALKPASVKLLVSANERKARVEIKQNEINCNGKKKWGVELWRSLKNGMFIIWINWLDLQLTEGHYRTQHSLHISAERGEFLSRRQGTLFFVLS